MVRPGGWGGTYLSMASSFSSSSFCRSITAMIMFLSSSVRWLRSGSSCIGGGTVGGRGPRGPTAEDIFRGLPAPSARWLWLSPFRFTPRSCSPAFHAHSEALPAAAAAAAAAAEPGTARTQSLMMLCLPPNPDAAFVWVALARLGSPPAASRSPASAGGGGQAEARREGEGWR